jgi:FkbM family methyltransferase
LEWVRWGEFIKPGSTAIDIGAHSGDTAIPMGLFGFDKQTGRKSNIIAVEPNPDLQGLLAICFDLNSHVANFSQCRAAITATDMDCVEISDHGNANCNGGIAEGYSETLTTRLKDSAKVVYKARGLSIPSLLRENNVDASDVTFIKIDCEGYDKEIIRGAKEFLAAVKPALFVEWFAWFSPEDDDDLFRAIDEVGYAPFHPGSLEPIDRSLERLSDITCLPKK